MIDLAEAFDKYKDEYDTSDFEKPYLTAFNKLDLLGVLNHDILGSAEHDEVCLDVDCEKLAEVATEADIKLLVQLGILFDNEVDSLFVFV